MKKFFLTIVLAAVLGNVLQAQDTRISTDTLPCGIRMPNYWYGAWYDTTNWYLYGSGLDSIHVYNDGRDTFYYHWDPHYLDFECTRAANDSNYTAVFKQYATHPIRIKGIWGMVSQNSVFSSSQFPWGVLDSTRLPEDYYLYLPKPGDTDRPGPFHLGPFDLMRIATVRWDTAQPKMMCLQSTLDTVFAGQNYYCHVYEALFDTVYTVQGEFWLGGSQHSNLIRQYGDPAPHGWLHFPTFYLTFGACFDRWFDTNALVARANTKDGPFYLIDGTWKCRFGPFGVITDGQRYLEVSSADTLQGLGLYTAFYPDSTYQTITGVPNRGYVFSHWNDGDTSNPRTVYVVSDTSFTAYFDPLPLYSVEVASNGSEHGEVRGGGSYYRGETARIEARPSSGYRFVCWNDSVTDNPRTIVVTQDTAFTALIEAIPYYTVDVFSNNEAYGRVAGGGTFEEGTEIRIEAVPNTDYHFWRWNDSVTDNPRTIVVTQDTAFTAVFGTFQGIGAPDGTAALFTLTPNPARESVTVTLDRAGLPAEITVYDAAGHAVLQRHATARRTRLSTRALPSGHYFVTVATPRSTSTQKLVID